MSDPPATYEDASSYGTVHCSSNRSHPPTDIALEPPVEAKLAQLETKLVSKLDETIDSKLNVIDITLSRILASINNGNNQAPRAPINTQQFPPNLASLANLSLQDAQMIQSNMDSKYKFAQARMNIQDDFIEFNETNINTLRADVQDVGIPTTDPDTGVKSTQPTSTNFRTEKHNFQPTPQSTYPHKDNPHQQHLYYQGSNPHDNKTNSSQYTHHSSHHDQPGRPAYNAPPPSGNFFDLINNQISMHPNETPLKHKQQNESHHHQPQLEIFETEALEIKYTKYKFKTDKFTQPTSMKNDDILSQEAFSYNVNQILLICSGSGPPGFPPYATLSPDFNLVNHFFQHSLTASAEARRFETYNVISMLLLNFLRHPKTIPSRACPRANNFILTTHNISDGIVLYDKLIK